MGVPKTTLKCDDFAEGFTELTKAVLVMVMIYYSEMTRLESAKEKAVGQIQERPGAGSQRSPPMEAEGQHLTVPAMPCDNIREVLPARAAHPSLGVHDFIGVWSHRHGAPTWLL